MKHMKMLQKRWSVKVVLVDDTWVWCQKSLQDHLQKFRLNENYEYKKDIAV